MDPELPKTLTLAASASKTVHDLITVLEEEFTKLKAALVNSAALLGNAHTAVLASAPVIPDAPPAAVKPAPEFTMPTHPHIIEQEPPIHHS